MMRLSLNFVFFTLMITFFSGCSVFGIRSGYEQLEYTVVDKVGAAEIRKYPPRVVAEVNGTKDDNAAFMLLFRYISGQNGSSEKVSMTAPVQVDKSPTKIAMTAPVEKFSSATDAVSMRFFLPSTFSVDSAPTPNDSRIKIVDLPEETFAVLTYSGINSDERFLSQSVELLETLEDSKWKPVSAASFFGYDPPFTVPFLRRNEAVVGVELR